VSCDYYCQERLSPEETEPFRSPWEPPRTPVSPMSPLSNLHGCTRQHSPKRPLDFQYETTPVALARPSTHHSLAILTAGRPRPSLLETLHSLDDAGLGRWEGQKIMYSDGPAIGDEAAGTIRRQGWSVLGSVEPRGAAWSFSRLLRLCLASDPSLDRLTFVEDDVELCRNALDYVGRMQTSTLLSWFTYDYDWSYPGHDPACPSQVAAADRTRGILARRPARYFILTQACTLPRQVVDLVLACPHASERWPKPDGHDEMITWALGDAPYAVHFPILAQHSGHLNSAVEMARERRLPAVPTSYHVGQSPYYVGREFDAMSLATGVLP